MHLLYGFWPRGLSGKYLIFLTRKLHARRLIAERPKIHRAQTKNHAARGKRPYSGTSSGGQHYFADSFLKKNWLGSFDRLTSQ